MSRRTKEDAFLTRCSILDAAEELFQQHGVSSTSLHAIAQRAGVTRGAVYWHFKDKSDLFNAMMERVCLPLEAKSVLLASPAGSDPLHLLRRHLMSVLERLVAEPQMQRVFEIATQKVEYAGELLKVRQRHLDMRAEHISVMERTLRSAQKQGLVAASPPARQVAIGLHALLDGLIQNWMLDPQAFDLRRLGARALDTHLAGLAARAR
jgi:TetR/AcrR family transcriptional regulator, acrAB operon repressor